MKIAIATITVALTLVTGLLQSDRPKTLPEDVGVGRVAWFDLTTTDLPRSKEFYAGLFDWTFGPVKGTDLAVEIVASGTPVGTIRVAEGAISAYNGVVYVQVADIAASCAKAKELGATLAPGFPFDLPDGIGAIGLVLDPTGHPLGMYSRTPLAAGK